MFIKNHVVWDLIRSVLVKVGITNPDALTQKIMDELVKWQKVTALKGSEKGGRPKKKIKFDTMRGNHCREEKPKSIA